MQTRDILKVLKILWREAWINYDDVWGQRSVGHFDNLSAKYKLLLTNNIPLKTSKRSPENNDNKKRKVGSVVQRREMRTRYQRTWNSTNVWYNWELVNMKLLDWLVLAKCPDPLDTNHSDNLGTYGSTEQQWTGRKPHALVQWKHPQLGLSGFISLAWLLYFIPPHCENWKWTRRRQQGWTFHRRIWTHPGLEGEGDGALEEKRTDEDQHLR